MQVHSLSDVFLSIHEEIELQDDGVTNGTATFISDKAKFLSNGVVQGDRVFIINRGFFTVVGSPASETELTLDKIVYAGSDLKFSVARDIPQRIRGSIAIDYPGSGDLTLKDGRGFSGILTGSYSAIVGQDPFTYTSREGNVLKGVSGLAAHSKFEIVYQELSTNELLFVQSLRINQNFQKAKVPQFRTNYKKKVILSEEIQLSISAFLVDLDYERRLKEGGNEYSIRVFYYMPETLQEDGFNLIGCSLDSEGVGNQDNQNSMSELVYAVTFKDTFTKE
jgi:hypothetical protein